MFLKMEEEEEVWYMLKLEEKEEIWRICFTIS